MNLLSWLDRHAGRILAVTLLLLGLIALLALVSCGEVPPPRGSAQDQAAGATARADSTTRAADAAEIDAATKGATAHELERQAVQDPTPERIRAAADARVEAAAAQAVAQALRRQSAEATTAATGAAVAARQEREADARAASDLAWVELTRWVGLIGVGAGVLLGGLLGWLVTPRLGILTGLLVTGTGLACTAYGASIRWLPLALLAAIALALVAWALAHWRIGRVGVALSRALDAAESDPHPTLAAEIDTAKAELGKAVQAAGLESRFEKLRGEARTWGREVSG